MMSDYHTGIRITTLIDSKFISSNFLLYGTPHAPTGNSGTLSNNNLVSNFFSR